MGRSAATALVPALASKHGGVHRGDAFDLSVQLEQESVDLICTSPPYWGLRTYGLEHRGDILARHLDTGGTLEEPPSYESYRKAGGVLGLEPSPDWYVSYLCELFDRLRPALTQTASVWVNLGDTYFARWSSIRAHGRQGLKDGERQRRRTPSGGYRHDKQLLMIPARFAIAMQQRGWILRNDLIWAKPNIPPRPERDRLRLSHEHFFHFVLRRSDRRPTYYYDIGAVETGAKDVVEVQSAGGESDHSARFPRALIEPRIQSSSPPAGIVLDPFCGSGTTLLLVEDLDRVPIGFELSREYAMLARRELRRARANRSRSAQHSCKTTPNGAAVSPVAAT